MLSHNAVRATLAAGGEVHGLFAAIGDPTLVEMIGAAGYDFAILDTEHALVDPRTLEHLIRAAETAGLTPFVRVPSGDDGGGSGPGGGRRRPGGDDGGGSGPGGGRRMPGDDDGGGVDPGVGRRASGVDGGAILRALDAGAMGVVVPHVRSAADVEAAVRAARYAPEGMRSLNGGRGPGFGTLDLREYLALANAEIMVIAMIEDAEGVEEIDAILAVPGLDMVLEGAADLSQSLGVAWQTRHPRVTTALAHVAERCAAAGIPYCALPREPGDIAGWRAAGVRAFVLGEERSIAARALRAHREAHRR